MSDPSTALAPTSGTAFTTPQGLEVCIDGNPDFGFLDCQVPPGATLIVESGAMAHMSSDMKVKSRLMGGILKALIRKVFGGESLFVGEYRHDSGGRISISPAVPGCVLHRAMQGETIYMQGGAFLACTPGVDIGTKFGGLKALFSGEGAFFLAISGTGDLFFNAHGNIHEIEVNGPFVVDTGHVVGWESSLDWKVKGVGGLKATLLSGEGLVLEFSGRGKVWVQTRNLGGLAGWVSSYCR